MVKYVQGVLLFDRKNIDAVEIEKVFGPQAPNIIGRMKSSVGSELSDEDMAQIRLLASQIQQIWKLRDEVEKYEVKIAKEICPNVSYLAGPELAAKLVAQAGGLQRLASFPSSTIQVLGAEKALFKHLRSGSKPPKHGILFQHPLVGMSPKKVRGKIARALAGKIAIATKADAISHNFIAEKLKVQFETHANKIIAAAPKSEGGPQQYGQPQRR
ncbi:MAG: NOP5/NOP56 family protein [Candidatus Micrarchaeota archaeon]|nr:NOP5/NOP56 family protein [Candidatus Micrarchaeota archaeon]